MTTYFDRIRQALHDATSQEEIQKLDEQLVTDCSTATMQPEFPEDLRDAIDEVILKWSPYANDRLQSAPWTGETDYEDAEAHLRCVLHLESELHGIFHVRAQRDRDFGDNPKAWLSHLILDAEERREALAVRLRGSKPNLG